MKLHDKIRGSKYFKWSDVTRDEQFLFNKSVDLSGIVNFAIYLDSIRNRCGDGTFSILSWHRPGASLLESEGIETLYHIKGLAIDVRHEFLTPLELYGLLDSLHGHRGAVGLYEKYVHLDMRGYRRRYHKL